jgi:hypothetical protein
VRTTGEIGTVFEAERVFIHTVLCDAWTGNLFSPRRPIGREKTRRFPGECTSAQWYVASMDLSTRDVRDERGRQLGDCPKASKGSSGEGVRRVPPWPAVLTCRGRCHLQSTEKGRASSITEGSRYAAHHRWRQLTNFGTVSLGGDRQHWHVAPLTLIQPVEQVQAGRSTASRARDKTSRALSSASAPAANE